MKMEKFTVKTTAACLLLFCAAWLAVPANSCAQTVIGSWQSGSDDGWIDWGNSLSITNPSNASKYGFVSAAVSGYGKSLQITQAGYNQSLAIKLEYLTGGNAAFLTNHLLSFTFSVPSAASSGATAGYSQLYAVSINATGYGFHDQSTNNFTTAGSTNNNLGWQPNFNFFAGAAARSQTVTIDYSSILSNVTATAGSGYIEVIFSFNNGGGAPANFFINNVILSGGGGGTVVSNPPASGSGVIGSWQGTSDDGWIDWGNTLSITNPANAAKYSFVAGAVSGYAQSLQITQAGYNQSLAVKLEYLTGGNAAFLTNHLLSFTFSVPSAASSGATAGYSQLYAVSFNASGYGFHDQSTNNFTTTGSTNNNLGWQPNFNFFAGAAARAQTVTIDYSSILSSVTATPGTGYIEVIFSFNNGGGAPANFFINNVTLTGGAGGTVVSNPPASSSAIGSWQGTSDDGWIDWGNALSITNAANTAKYNFVSAAVSGYAQSLQITQAGYNQSLAVKLENLPGAMAAFLTNHLLSFTFSVPSAASSGATAGYSQLYAVSINTSGYGFHDQATNQFSANGSTNNNLGWQPNFNFFAGAAARSEVVTLDYSSILPAVTATAGSGYIEIIFSFNNGGGAPANFFMNNVTLSGGSGGSGTVTSNPPSAFTFSLLAGPNNSSLNSSNGVFTWRPLVSQAGTTNLVTVKVTDGTQNATNSFHVVVNPLVPFVITPGSVSGGHANLTVSGTQGPDYTVLVSSNLVNWDPLFTTNPPALPVTLSVPVSGTNPAAFYRIQVGP